MCSKCKRTFKTHQGLQQHQRSCKENQVTQSNLTILSSRSISLNTDTCDNIWNENITLIERKIYSAYNEIIYWKKLLFLLPTGAAGKGFIAEMIRLVNSWTYKSDLETIALKALMIMLCLLLQKTFLNSKSKENSETLKRRFSLWKNGQLDQLMFEGKTIQDRPQNIDRVATKNSKEALTFGRIIEEGKVNKAIKILEKANRG